MGILDPEPKKSPVEELESEKPTDVKTEEIIPDSTKEDVTESTATGE